MKFARLVDYFEQVEETSLRNEMMEILAKLLGEAGESEVGEIVYLSLGRLRPKYEKLEFSLAEKMVVRAVAVAVKLPIIFVRPKNVGKSSRPNR